MFDFFRYGTPSFFYKRENRYTIALDKMPFCHFKGLRIARIQTRSNGMGNSGKTRKDKRPACPNKPVLHVKTEGKVFRPPCFEREMRHRQTFGQSENLAILKHFGQKRRIKSRV